VKSKKTLCVKFNTIFLSSLSLIFGFLVDSAKADVAGNPSLEQKKDINNIKNNLVSPKSNANDLNFKGKKDEPSKRKFGLGDKSEPTILLKGVSFSGNKKYGDKELLNYFKDLIGKKVTFSTLINSTIQIQNLYRNNGFITSQVLIAKQDFKSGYIKVSILESFIEEIVILGGTKGSRSYVEYMTKGILYKNNKDKIFKFDDLERQLLLIRKTGIADISSTLSQGKQKGGSILTIKLDNKPFAASVFSNTHLSENLGDYQFGIGTSYTTKNSKPIRFSSIAKYAFPVEDGLKSGIVSLEKPIANKGLSLSALYAYTETETKDLFPDTSGDSVNKGESEYISLSLGYPLILKRNSGLSVDLATTIQNSSSDFYLNDVKTNNVSTDRIRAARLGMTGRKDFKNSSNFFNFEISKGIDGLDNEISSTEFKSDLDAKADFTKYKFDFVRQQYLNLKGLKNLNLELKASGQLTPDNLPVPEKLSFGGHEFGKGFKNSHIFGDEGWVSSVKLSKNFRKGKGFVAPYIWYDYGSTSDLDSTDDDYTASTLGIGIGGKLNKHSSYDLSVGFPTTDESNPDDVGTDHKIFGFNLGYSF
tara:strand:- start:1182 stop:2948 length:1767 start_codon:yes stop_codon:yes gene_type:complete